MKRFVFLITLFSIALFSAGLCAAPSGVDKGFTDHIRQSDGMNTISTRNHSLDVSQNLIEEETDHHIIGLAPSGVQITATDIWDRADASATQQTWTAPTAARLHNIASSSASDDGDPAGVGARTLRIYGLTSWTLPEVIEDLLLNGTSNVSTVGAYVIIHKMEVLTKGATNTNVGAITATAVSDSTVTQVILAGEGETHSAILGLSSIEDAYIKSFDGSINDSQATATSMTLSIMVNPEPDSELLNFNKRITRGLQSTGISANSWPFDPPIKVKGPAIIKVSGYGSRADIDGSAGINLVKRTDTSGFTVLMTNDLRVLTTSNGSVLRTQQ